MQQNDCVRQMPNLKSSAESLGIKRPVGVGLNSIGRANFEFVGHSINCIFAIGIIGAEGGQGLPLGFLRSMYVFSILFSAWLMWRKRNNVLFLARTLILILPGYYAAGVQLWNPDWYYSIYERVSQTLDISMTMYALSSLALLGSELGIWCGSSVSKSSKMSNSISDEFHFYAAVVPLFAVSYYVSLMYGKSLFEASYASVAGLSGIGSSSAIGAILVFVMFQNYQIKPKLVKGVILAVGLSFFLIYGMLIRGGRQDVLSCLFGLYVIYWGQKKSGAPLSTRIIVAGLVGFIFMEYLGFIRGNVLGRGFHYADSFVEFIRSYLYPNGVVSFGTISPIASTFANTLYALKTDIAGHIWGKGYWEYILRTPPEFLYPNRPSDYAWIFVDWKLSAGGGFFELAEAYLNFGIVGVVVVPMTVSFVIARVFSRYVHEASMLSSFMLFGILSVFLRGSLYQTFAFYKAVIAGLVLMLMFAFLDRLRTSGRGVSVKPREL